MMSCSLRVDLATTGLVGVELEAGFLDDGCNGGAADGVDGVVGTTLVWLKLCDTC